MDVFALTVYNILLFPNIEDFVIIRQLMCLLLLKLDLKIRSRRTWQTPIRHLICAMREKKRETFMLFACPLYLAVFSYRRTGSWH